ncbi:MAG TPA: hypothetical protein VMN36_11180 [Verrucomicrobiales bacterium]|nr:hypothetical protein [Verrucomicrobiales bacterium]
MQSAAPFMAVLALSLSLPAGFLTAAEPDGEAPALDRETFVEGSVVYACRNREDRRPADSFPDVPRDLGKRLGKAFRDLDFRSFQTVETQTQPIYKAYDSWIFPDSRFKLVLNSQGRTSDGGLKVIIQLWQDDLVLLKSDTILRGDSPLFIAGNPWGRGRLLFVLRLRNAAGEDGEVKGRARER